MAQLSIASPRAAPLPPAHALLALAVMIVWGTNFVVIRVALQHLPPLLFASLRFSLVVFPAILFIKRPAAPWKHLAAYGLLIGAGQFGILFIAMKSSISPGLASLVMQTQVFFTIGLAMALNKERVRGYQWAALVLAFVGLGVILMHAGKGAATPLGLVLTLTASASWAGGNAVSRASGRVNMLAYVVWSSLFAVPPLIILSIMFDGLPAIEAGLAHADMGTWGAVASAVCRQQHVRLCGLGLAARAPSGGDGLADGSAGPVFGMAASAFVLAEALPVWKVGAALLIMSGLALNLLWPPIQARLASRA